MSTKFDSFAVRPDGEIAIDAEFEDEAYGTGCRCCSCYHSIYFDIAPEKAKELYGKLKEVFEK